MKLIITLYSVAIDGRIGKFHGKHEIKRLDHRTYVIIYLPAYLSMYSGKC
jgi:hypothetical protein